MEPCAQVQVIVTFLRMETPPTFIGPALPADVSVARVDRPTVPFYRFLYDTVGADYLWWLRRSMADADLAALLADPRIAIHVLYRADQPIGFFELDARPAPDLNLSYFGLMPGAIGTGLGSAFLRCAIDTAWARGPRWLTVNTCNADHPRALPGYLRAGFRPIRHVRERWPVPLRLGMRIPDLPRG
jgi:GNAT superfamily N-acetyltransferase